MSFPDKLPPIYYPYVCPGGDACAHPKGYHIRPLPQPVPVTEEPPYFYMNINGSPMKFYHMKDYRK